MKAEHKGKLGADLGAPVAALGDAQGDIQQALLALGVLAGGFIGLGAMFYTVVVSDAGLGFAVARVLGGLVFSLGLILVVLAAIVGSMLSLAGASYQGVFRNPLVDPYLPRTESARLVELLARLVISYFLAPSDHVDLGSPESARSFLNTFVLPAFEPSLTRS